MIENTKKRGTGFTEKTENLQEQRFPKLNWSRPWATSYLKVACHGAGTWARSHHPSSFYSVLAEHSQLSLSAVKNVILSLCCIQHALLHLVLFRDGTVLYRDLEMCFSVVISPLSFWKMKVNLYNIHTNTNYPQLLLHLHSHLCNRHVALQGGVGGRGEGTEGHVRK